MDEQVQKAGRRSFLKAAGVLAAGTAAGCTLETRPPASAPASAATERETGFDRTLLSAVGHAVLPEELGAQGMAVAIDRFVAWIDAYEPVAEEMHGYGYADIRYLPPDPAPGWRAQLAALDLLAKRSKRKPFARLTPVEQRELIAAALGSEAGDRLPAPLEARHVALALLSHWASSADAWDLALGAKVQPNTCRVLGDANARPLPIVGLRA
jgi:hypothetical protein